MKLFVGSQGGTVATPWGSEREILEGERCWTAAHKYKGAKGDYPNPVAVRCLLDSGAFSDPRDRRLSFAEALDRQLQWEEDFSRRMNANWQSFAIASYDLLIDEKWSGLTRSKARWELDEAWLAVEETIAAAEFIADHRASLAPRKLVLGVQGVDAEQYLSCLDGVLSCAIEADWIGLGGWCILGMPQFRHWMPEFETLLSWAIPKIAIAGIKHVHLYGVLHRPAIGLFAYICDHWGLSASVDNARPILDCKRRSPQGLKKAGAQRPYWRDNVAYWRNFCEQISQSEFYTMPQPRPKQLLLSF